MTADIRFANDGVVSWQVANYHARCHQYVDVMYLYEMLMLYTIMSVVFGENSGSWSAIITPIGALARQKLN